MMLNPLFHPVCFSTPDLLKPSAWLSHIPFAMYLVDILRPELIVELGTHTGVSYCAFCQAVKELRLGTRCYAIDSWEGDPQAGFYGPEVLSDLRTYHDPLYDSFSTLIKSKFDDGLDHFNEGEIDLLHIDGYHSYDSVKHDFESWLPKMSDRGVVLLHDINVRRDDFGVRKLWEEIKSNYPSFEFYHGHGLGLLAVGSKIPKTIMELIGSNENAVLKYRLIFSELGKHIEGILNSRLNDNKIKRLKVELSKQTYEKESLTDEIEELKIHLSEYKEKNHKLIEELVDKNASAQESQRELSRIKLDLNKTEAKLNSREIILKDINNRLLEIYNSNGWEILQFLWKVRVFLAPPGSKRESIGKRIIAVFDQDPPLKKKIDPILFALIWLGVVLFYPAQYRICRRWNGYSGMKDINPHPVVPRTINDKFYWRKIFDRDPRFTTISDKLAIKDWVTTEGFKLATARVLWSGTDANFIPAEILDGDVILKANHGSNMQIMIHDGKYDRSELIEKANKFLGQSYGKENLEWGYLDIPRKLFVEEILAGAGPELVELKYYTYGTKIERLIAIYDRYGDIAADVWMPDEDGRFYLSDERTSISNNKRGIPLPATAERMEMIAREIGSRFDHMRVDLYTDGQEVWLGELTIYNLGGYIPDHGFDPDSKLNVAWDLRQSWFLSTPQKGWRKLYAAALIRKLNNEEELSDRDHLLGV